MSALRVPARDRVNNHAPPSTETYLVKGCHVGLTLLATCAHCAKGGGGLCEESWTWMMKGGMPLGRAVTLRYSC